MMFLPDHRIRDLCMTHLEKPMISPFEAKLVREVGMPDAGRGRKVISYGLSSYGYDVRLDPADLPFYDRHYQGAIIDPKNFDKGCLRQANLYTNPNDGSMYWWVPPHTYCLGVTIEEFNIPRDITGIAFGKSTY